jgi:predicted GH43/DUF377 family glycosyl hydrolase
MSASVASIDSAAIPFSAQRLGVLMSPAPGDPLEVEGVLNPALMRGPDGCLYLFPRMVGAGNYSRIGVCRVIFDQAGEPVDVERLGVALQPEEPYELNPVSGGGVEDPRITFVPELRRYLLTYTAYSPRGPRVAIAVSEDLRSWRRLGLARFAAGAIELNDLDNKDAVFFPALVPGPDGAPSLAMIHRPLLPGTASAGWWAAPEERAAAKAQEDPKARPTRHPRGSMWISYCSDLSLDGELRFERHHRLLSPRASWERLKIGAGSPPLLTRHGWLVVYHGVRGSLDPVRLRYCAGVAILAATQPERVLYRSSQPILSPGPEERSGMVPNVVFPTGLDQRLDLGRPDRIDVYFGMADNRIGVATMTLPAVLPELALPRSRRNALAA